MLFGCFVSFQKVTSVQVLSFLTSDLVAFPSLTSRWRWIADISKVTHARTISQNVSLHLSEAASRVPRQNSGADVVPNDEEWSDDGRSDWRKCTWCGLV